MSSPLSSAVSLPPDVHRGYQYIAVQWSLVPAAIIIVFSRFCIRGVLRRRIGGDDYMILAALACTVAQSIVAILQVKKGFGRNIQYLQPTEIQDVTRDIFITILFNLTGTYFVRISVCLFMLQLLPFTQRFSRWWTYGLMVFFTVIALATFLSMCFICIPLQGFWDSSIKAHCISPAVTTKINQAQGSFSVLMDILCVLLPVVVFRKLQINRRDKLALFILLGLGLLPAGAAVARTVLYNFGSDNPTWALLPDAIWACVEQNTGIIVASMPSLRQFFTVVKKQHSSRHSHSSEKPFRRGSPFIASPLSPSTDNTQSDHIPSLDSPVSTVAEKMEKQQDADKGNNSSPTMSIVSRFRPMSFSGEKVHGVNGHQDAEAKECNAKDCNKDWEQRRESRPTLGNHAVLGYSCKIEGGSSNLTA